MAIYWMIFLYFAAGALAAQPPAPKRSPVGIFFDIGTIVLLVVIGLRYEVGGDWGPYKLIFRVAGRRDFLDALSIGDPGYQALNWLVYQWGVEIWLVNLFCAAFFVWGLRRFCVAQPLPWLAALVAIPYVVIVVAMGYTRQAVALGVLMAGLAVFFRGGSVLRFAAYVCVAALFHRTAVIAFPLVALAADRNRVVNLLVVAATSLFFYDMFLGDAMDTFIRNYIQTRYSSQGAAIRIAMNTAAALVFWLAGRQLGFTELESRVWRNFSLATLALLALLFISPSSTAVDRISLYVIPLQIAVLSRVPLAFTTRLPATVLVGAYMFLVQFVWLNFAKYANYWVPYQFYPV